MIYFKISPLNHSSIMRIVDDQEIINLQPSYQRPGDIWTLENKKLFIDTIINNYDVPKIYFHEFKESKNEFKYAVIDGQQRLKTIFNFRADKFPCLLNLSLMRMQA